MTKLNMTSELFATGGFRKSYVRKNLFENNYEREKFSTIFVILEIIEK